MNLHNDHQNRLGFKYAGVEDWIVKCRGVIFFAGGDLAVFEDAVDSGQNGQILAIGAFGSILSLELQSTQSIIKHWDATSYKCGIPEPGLLSLNLIFSGP